MHGGEAIPEGTVPFQQRHRGAPMGGGALLVLRRLLARHVSVERRATAGGPVS